MVPRGVYTDSGCGCGEDGGGGGCERRRANNGEVPGAEGVPVAGVARALYRRVRVSCAWVIASFFDAGVVGVLVLSAVSALLVRSAMGWKSVDGRRIWSECGCDETILRNVNSALKHCCRIFSCV